jgi:predicted nuclease of predicted toxin-antitoxin system
VKLLLDENLSRRLVPFLQDEFPGTSHVTTLGLERATDREIWEFARLNDFAIVTSDADFEELSLLLGAPPFVIWLKGGNASKSQTLNLLTSHTVFLRQCLREGRACVEILKGAHREGANPLS